MVEQAFDFPTQNALIEVGVQAGWRCWEAGAGRGSVARWLHGVGSAGKVVATDLPEQWFDAAGADIVFRRHDVVRDPAPERDFDLVHARFLLEHVPDPRGVTARLADALRPGGAGWAHVAYGIERVRPELRAQGIAGEQIDAVLRCLADPQNLITGPPVAIAWGQRSSSGSGDQPGGGQR